MTHRAESEYESWGETLRASVKWALVWVAVLIVLAIAGYFVFHAWYVDTHCTTIAGTQVCN